MGLITNKIYICLPFEKEVDKLDWNGLSTEEYNGKTYYKIPSGGNGSDVVKKITFETLYDNVTVTLNIVSSSEKNWDFAYACELDGPSRYSNAKYNISGNNQSITCEYVVPKKGSHWIYIGYKKDYSGNQYNDCGYFSIDNSDKEYAIRQPKEVYLASNKMNEITYGSKKILERGLGNTISWETLTWNKSNNSYTYNTKDRLTLYYVKPGYYNGTYAYLWASPASTPNDNEIKSMIFSGSYSGNTYNFTYKLDLSDWNTSNVTDMSSMFSNCYALTYIDLSKFNTSNVTNMARMFSNCYALTNLDVSKFNTSNVTNMACMFSNCYALTYIDLSKFNTSNVTNMGEMFAGTGKINMIDMSKFDLSKLYNENYESGGFGKVFKGSYCENIKLPNMNLKKKFNTYYGDTFSVLYRLKSLQAPELVNSYTNNIRFLFADDNELYDVDMSDWDFSNVTYAYGAFYGTKISNVSVNLSNTKDSIYSMFRFSYADSINISNLEISNKITDTKYMFDNTKSTTIDFVDSNGNTKFDTSGVTNMSYMFSNSKNLTTINGLNKLNTSNLKDIGAMFYNCNSLTSIDISDWDTSNINNVKSKITDDNGGLFENCFKLVDLKLPRKFITAKVNNISGMFNNTRLTSLDLSDWDTSNVYSMRYLFNNDIALERLNLVGWDASRTSSTDWIFVNCTELTTLIDGHESEPDVTIFNGLKYSISLTDSSKLNYESVYALFRGVSADGDRYYKNIYLPKVMQGKLDPDKVKIATDKGWTIAYK